mmetsp:Transcript_62209/g.115453  ORF Transcript_62209/g.115453 Transcript_62209/m.115453 type:complete len:428 (+) Transcript_62209:104-1387(+)
MDNFVTKNTFLEPKDEEAAPNTRRFKTEPAPMMADSGLDEADSEEAESDTLPTLLSEAEALRHPQFEEDVKATSDIRMQVKNTFITYNDFDDEEEVPSHLKSKTEPVFQQDRSSSSSSEQSSGAEEYDSLPTREPRFNFKTCDPFDDKDDSPSQSRNNRRGFVTKDEFEEDLMPQGVPQHVLLQGDYTRNAPVRPMALAQPEVVQPQPASPGPAYLKLETALQPPLQTPQPPPMPGHPYAPFMPPLFPPMPMPFFAPGAGCPQPDAQAPGPGSAKPCQPTACPKGQRRPPRLWAHIYLHMVSDGFDLVPMLIGREGSNVKRIASATGAKIRIRGKGSGHKENDNKEAPVPLMVAVTVDKSSADYFRKAVEMTVEELKRVAKRYEEHCISKNIEHSGPYYSLNVTGEDAAACLTGIFDPSEMVQQVAS